MQFQENLHRSCGVTISCYKVYLSHISGVSTRPGLGPKKPRPGLIWDEPFYPAVPTCKMSPHSVHTQPWLRRKKWSQTLLVFPRESVPQKMWSHLSPCLVSRKTQWTQDVDPRKTLVSFMRPRPPGVPTRPWKCGPIWAHHRSHLSPSTCGGPVWDQWWTLRLFFYSRNRRHLYAWCNSNKTLTKGISEYSTVPTINGYK